MKAKAGMKRLREPPEVKLKVNVNVNEGKCLSHMLQRLVVSFAFSDCSQYASTCT